ncbi:hypothetical protein KAR10_04520, partial [bacterium]|nr:hypothetical protein [bacterium]
MNKGLVLLLSVLFTGSIIMAGCAPQQESAETDAPAVEEAVLAVEEAAPAVEGEAPAEEVPVEVAPAE